MERREMSKAVVGAISANVLAAGEHDHHQRGHAGLAKRNAALIAACLKECKKVAA